jgi:hypothetical protein
LLGPEDLWIWQWTISNATRFVRDFGLMAQLVERLRLDEITQMIFLRKVNMIYEMFLRINEPKE